MLCNVPGDDLHQLVLVDRFGNVVVHSSLEELLPVTEHSIRREGNDRQIFDAGM